MTPALHGQFRFTSASGTGSAVTFPYLAPGTPLALCAGIHAFWRSSVRIQCRFYCPAFVSARFLFVLSPLGVPTVDSVANNLTRVIDVKGDTVDSFTLPMLWPVDFLPGSTALSANVPYAIQVSVLTQIVTNDTSLTPSIDLVMFSAAGPDCQFSAPVYDAYRMDYSYPNNISAPPKKKQVDGKKEEAPLVKKTGLNRSFRGLKFFDMERQCSINEEFKKEFSPFLMDCEYLTDSHHVTSETTLYVTDLLKRYQQCSALTLTSGVGTLPALYTPDASTLGYLISRCFLFQRGGVRYKFVENSEKFMCVAYGIAPTGWSGQLTGNGSLVAASPSAMEMSISVPWIQQIPYASQLINIENVMLDCNVYYNTTLDSLNVYTAARDDFQLGFLVAPDVYS
jgi:hypothetical protein